MQTDDLACAILCSQENKSQKAQEVLSDAFLPFIQERPKWERIDCVCGAGPEGEGLSEGRGLWVQCDGCLAWLHAACVGLKSSAQRCAVLHVALFTLTGHTYLFPVGEQGSGAPVTFPYSCASCLSPIP